jgi:GntR family transcriptional repressor for pyruvate dehydrogenase complex
MTGTRTKGKSPGSAVRRAAAAIRQLVLACKDGALLGSKSEMLQRIGTSRPTFRQAAKLVEQEQLLLIKRGIGGGFFARRPASSGVAHMAAVYLHARRATVEDVIRAARPVFADIARNAAMRADPHIYSRLAAF